MAIDGIKIVKQKRNNTCGFVSTGMILIYFQGSNMDRGYLFKAISFRNDCLPEFIKKSLPGNAMIGFSKSS